jgi:alkylation response protein AidB-like acyl-CoA dehydrogenase
MDFEWSEEQQVFRQSVIEFCRGELGKDLSERDQQSSFPAEDWVKCAHFGILGLPVPEAYGGSEASPTTIVAALEAMGYGCADNGLLFSLNAQMWACQYPLIRFGTEEQKRRYLPPMCDGSLIAAHGMSEPSSGSDAFSLAMSAEKRDGCYVLRGSKTFVTNAPVAGLFVVFARVGNKKGFGGLTCFLVERDTPGLTVGSPLHKMGLRTSPMSELFFDDCVVSDKQVLGRAGAGMVVFTAAMEQERSLILACTVGTMQRQLEQSISYAREREQFGQPIGKFQAVSHRIVEMKLRLETARLMLYRLAWLMESGKDTALDSALTKLHLSDCFVRSSLDALHVYGGYGYMTEYGLERDHRDAIGSQLYSGTSDIQKNLVARRLLGI